MVSLLADLYNKSDGLTLWLARWSQANLGDTLLNFCHARPTIYQEPLCASMIMFGLGFFLFLVTAEYTLKS